MINYFPTKRNKQQKHLKVSFQNYIYTPRHPYDDVSSEVSVELEAKLRGSIKEMRREFKRASKRIMGLYSSKAPKKLVYTPVRPIKIGLPKPSLDI